MKQHFCRTASAVFFSFIISACAAEFAPQESSLGMNGEKFLALSKASVKARIDNPQKNQYLFFKFTENQKAHLSNVRYKNTGAGISVTISFKKEFKQDAADVPFVFGLLLDDDFSKGLNVQNIISSRGLITGNFKSCLSDSFRLLFSVAQNAPLPAGFFIYGTAPFSVTEAQITEAKIGWEHEAGRPPLFAFGPSGGSVQWNFSGADFRDARNLFPVQNLPARVMPKTEISVRAEEGAAPQKKVRLSVNGQNISIRLNRSSSAKTVQSAAFENGIEKIGLTENAELVDRLIMSANAPSLAQGQDAAVLFPLKTDLGLVMDWPQKNWRRADYELFEWELFPGVLFFDFSSYAVQNQFFTRLAYFAEKAGYKGTLVSDDFVKNKHGYNAHDYKAEDLAAFFSEAERQQFALNEYELLLKEILEANRIIIKGSGGFTAGDGAVISFSRESPRYLRHTFLAHESWHGIFFTTESFRNVCAACYTMFDPGSLEFIQTFWETQPGLGYDRNDEYLMQNEFMAYIMQQPVSSVRSYFLQVAGRGSVNRMQGESAQYIRDTQAQAFVDAAEVLNSYALDTWGLACGRVSLVSRD